MLHNHWKVAVNLRIADFIAIAFFTGVSHSGWVLLTHGSTFSIRLLREPLLKSFVSYLCEFPRRIKAAQ